MFLFDFSIFINYLVEFDQHIFKLCEVITSIISCVTLWSVLDCSETVLSHLESKHEANLCQSLTGLLYGDSYMYGHNKTAIRVVIDLVSLIQSDLVKT